MHIYICKYIKEEIADVYTVYLQMHLLAPIFNYRYKKIINEKN